MAVRDRPSSEVPSTLHLTLQPEPHHLRVTRTARYYILGELSPRVTDVWIVCHGYGQLAHGFCRAFAAIADAHRVIVAPEALNRYYIESAPGVHGPDARVGATWMTRHDREHEIADYIAYLDTLAGHVMSQSPHARVTALGFSQGAATVSRWASAGGTVCDHVILWGSSIAHDIELRPDLFRNARLTIAVGDADEYLTEERVLREQERLRAEGVQCELLRYTGAHRIEPAALAALTT